MKVIVKIIPIGNSKGIRIPSSVLKQCDMDSQVFMEVKNRNIIIRPAGERPRKDWGRKFKEMKKNGDDGMIIDDVLDMESDAWEW